MTRRFGNDASSPGFGFQNRKSNALPSDRIQDPGSGGSAVPDSTSSESARPPLEATQVVRVSHAQDASCPFCHFETPKRCVILITLTDQTVFRVASVHPDKGELPHAQNVSDFRPDAGRHRLAQPASLASLTLAANDRARRRYETVKPAETAKGSPKPKTVRPSRANTAKKTTLESQGPPRGADPRPPLGRDMKHKARRNCRPRHGVYW